MMLILFITIPLFGAFLIALLGRMVKYASDFLAGLVALGLLVLSYHFLNKGVIVYKVGGWLPPMGINLVLDGLSGFMLVTVNLVVFMAMVYAFSYMKTYTDKWKFHSLIMFMLAGMNGVILSGDLFNMYVFLEMASIAGYVLVAFGVEPENLEAAFKYAVMGIIASIFILLGIALLYGYTSTLNMADLAYILASSPKTLIGFTAVLFIVGFGLKAALVPFHAWLPDAHSSAPTPVSAVLSGVFIKTLGIYVLMRVFFNIFSPSDKIFFIFMVLGIISMVVGALLAIAQNDIKRMFAYSSISQIGYIIFALGIGTPLAVLGGLFHLFNHAVFKSLLFLNAGAVEYATGTRNLNALGGLNKKLPVTGYTGLLGSMSISGIPPFGGFWSKLIIIIAAIQAGYITFAVIAVLVSIVTLAYYLKFQTFAFFGKLDSVWEKVKEVPFTMKSAMIILAFICIFAGILLMPKANNFLQSATDALLSPNYSSNVLGALK